jgi:hypothetical protein
LTKLEKFSERNFDEILPQEGIEFIIKEGLKLRGKDFKQALLDIENYAEATPCKILGEELSISQIARCILIVKCLVHMWIPTKDGKLLYNRFCQYRKFAKFLLPYATLLRNTDLDIDGIQGFKFLKRIANILKDKLYSAAAVLSVYRKLQNNEKLIFNSEKYIASILNKELGMNLTIESCYSKYFINCKEIRTRDLLIYLEREGSSLLNYCISHWSTTFEEQINENIREVILMIEQKLI